MRHADARAGSPRIGAHLGFTPGRSSRLLPGMETNRITTARRSLGVKLTDDNYCSTCPNDAWIQVNIDGIYSYLCASCWSRLVGYAQSPLR